jgi:hypothetical protein
MQVLALDIGGMPREWISLEQAVTYYARELVSWHLGDPIKTFRGGFQRSGRQSSIDAHPIVAIDTSSHTLQLRGKIALSNRTLFGRDRHMCAYCGHVFKNKDLSRDHIIPRSQGGENKWMNVVTACINCNTKKDARTPEEARMQLLFAPYVPNLYEHLLLQNRNILADQMEYLKAGVPKHSRLLHG